MFRVHTLVITKPRLQTYIFQGLSGQGLCNVIDDNIASFADIDLKNVLRCLRKIVECNLVEGQYSFENGSDFFYNGRLLVNFITHYTVILHIKEHEE